MVQTSSAGAASPPSTARPPPRLTMELDNVTAAVTAAADDLPLPRLLATVLLPAAQATDGAYRRLDEALRADTGRPHAAGGAAAAAPATGPPPPPPATTTAGGGRTGVSPYAVTCAHVTEDLKVAAEVLAALALALTARPPGDAPFACAAAVVGRLQAAEAARLVATVSLHVLRRSAAHGVADRPPLPPSMVAAAVSAGPSGGGGGGGGGPRVGNGVDDDATVAAAVADPDRLGRATRAAADAEEAVRDVLDEVREMIADAEEEAGGGGGEA